MVALGSGLLFGIGLLVSGMTQPSKILGFLDFFGAWDASLLFVMLGAISVHFFAYRFMKNRSRALLAPTLLIPTRSDINGKLVLGSALFGVGWGLSGFCPGPSVVALASGALGTLTFVGAMLLGLYAAGLLERRGQASATTAPSLPRDQPLA
jgi:uncharacterized membrane protein YedE/YeeE